MNQLRDILYKTGMLEVTGSTDKGVSGLSLDSRKVKHHDLFFAIRGTQTDGHMYIENAIQSGATAIICEEMPAAQHQGITYVKVQDAAKALGIAAANFYDHPSDKLRITGVTGTNGKTSIVTLLYTLFRLLGYQCGMFSTVKNMIGDTESEAMYTTPDPIQLNALLAKMVHAGCEYVFMEVSSHALDQKRVEGIRFAGAVFTNITHDHLDYHKTFKAYIDVKKSFFDGLEKNAFAITNADDKNGQLMLQNTKAKKITYALQTLADYHAKLLENTLTAMHLQIDTMDVWCKLVGRYNAYNLLATYAVARQFDIPKEELLIKLSQCGPPEGRFDHFTNNNNITAIIDYAHTPDALDNVLASINQVRKGNEKLITVVGCGGNRDTTKRPSMAAIAAANSEKIILTSDNPRMEEPHQIIEDMKAGLNALNMKKALVIVDRREAIRTACALANSGDIILIAGKGHEKYQEIMGVRYPFNDKQIAKEALGE